MDLASWDCWNNKRWGEDSQMVEEWFAAGETLQYSTSELEIDEPDRWERALQWMRSIFDSPRLRTA